MAHHLLIQLHRLLPGEGHGLFEEDGDAPLQRGERMFDVVDGVAGDEYEVEVGRIGQQLAVVTVEGRAKALLFLGGGIARVGHGDAADLRVLHRLEAVHVITSAAAKADDGETNCWCHHICAFLPNLSAAFTMCEFIRIRSCSTLRQPYETSLLS